MSVAAPQSTPARPPSPGAPPEVLEPWIVQRLRPLDAEAGSAPRPGTGEGAGEATAELIPAAVLIGLVERPHGLNVILTRRADTLRRHSGQVAFPGGRRDPGETAVTAALREAHEEVGLEPRFVRPCGTGDLHRTGTGFEIIPVVAFVRAGFTLTAAEAEVAEVFETPFAFLMDPANHEVRTWEGPAGERRDYYAMPHETRLIWGVTAGILRRLYERLFVG